MAAVLAVKDSLVPIDISFLFEDHLRMSYRLLLYNEAYNRDVFSYDRVQ